MKHKGFEYVDLDLPSGTKWAACNVGAKSETDYGLYFAWGETKGYSGITDTKQFCLRDYKFLKYNCTDGKKVLDLKDDAAQANMGGRWHMPSKEQFNELIANTNSTWENNYNGSGINGSLFISKSDDSKRLFIPASGHLSYGSCTNVGNNFDIWGNSIDTSYSSFENGITLHSNSDGSKVSQDGRYKGICVRGVLN